MCGGSLGQARAFGGAGGAGAAPRTASSGARPTPPRHRAGVASMAWRATHAAATASGPGRRRHRAARGAEPPERRPGAPRRRRRDGGRPTAAPRRRGARAGAVLSTSPVPSAPGPRAVRTHSKSHKKTPSAMILGNDAFAPSEGAATLRNAEIRTSLAVFTFMSIAPCMIVRSSSFRSPRSCCNLTYWIISVFV